MPITKQELAAKFTEALNNQSETEVNPAQARIQIGNDLADAVEAYVVGRQTQVTGSSQSGGPVIGTGVIQ